MTSEKTEHEESCGFALYGPPAICDCKPAPEPAQAQEVDDVLAWAYERMENTVRIAKGKTGADLEGWLEDFKYWRAIVARLKASPPHEKEPRRCDECENGRIHSHNDICPQCDGTGFVPPRYSPRPADPETEPEDRRTITEGGYSVTYTFEEALEEITRLGKVCEEHLARANAAEARWLKRGTND